MVSNVQAVTKTLLPLDDLDYAAAFSALAQVHAQMQRDGVCADLLLRRAHARYALGNYLAAAFDAERVAREEPDRIDAHFIKGQACLAMAAVKAGLAHPGVGVYMPCEALPERAHLLSVAARAFEAILALTPDDAQARRALATAQAWQQVPEAQGRPRAVQNG